MDLSKNAGKAWNNLPNGHLEAESSWPALSESERASKTSSSVLLNGYTNGSTLSTSEGNGTISSGVKKQVGTDGHSNVTVSQPTLQRSMNHTNSNHLSNGGPSQQPIPPSLAKTNPINPSSRDHIRRSGSPSQPYRGNNHAQQRNSFRSHNGGHPLVNGSHHQYYGDRPGQVHGNQSWNARQSYGNQSWNVHQSNGQPPRAVSLPSFVRIAPPNSRLVPPPAMRPSVPHMPINAHIPPMVYYAPPPLETLPAGTFAPTPHRAPFFHVSDPQLHAKIVYQINYYFSDENLIRDIYLRRNMDNHGWVSVILIAGFNRVRQLTDNIELILDALRMSTIVEVQDGRIRRRNNWVRWLLPPYQNSPAIQTRVNTSRDMLATRVQNITLEERTIVNNHVI